MKTIYAACIARLGLSLGQAADLHRVRIDTVKSWSSGRNPVPQGAWDDLRGYEATISDRADALLLAWENTGSPPIEIDAGQTDEIAMMSCADFILHSHGPLHIGETTATRMARQARRPN